MGDQHFCSCCLEIGTALEDGFKKAVHTIPFLEAAAMDNQKRIFPGPEHVVFDPYFPLHTEFTENTHQEGRLFAQFSPFTQNQEDFGSSPASLDGEKGNIRSSKDFNLNDSELAELNLLVRKSMVRKSSMPPKLSESLQDHFKNEGFSNSNPTAPTVVWENKTAPARGKVQTSALGAGKTIPESPSATPQRSLTQLEPLGFVPRKTVVKSEEPQKLRVSTERPRPVPPSSKQDFHAILNKSLNSEAQTAKQIRTKLLQAEFRESVDSSQVCGGGRQFLFTVVQSQQIQRDHIVHLLIESSKLLSFDDTIKSRSCE